MATEAKICRPVQSGRSAAQALRRCGASLSSEAHRVKVMKRLLPQPGDFEGLKTIQVALNPHHATVADIEDDR